MSKSSKTPEIFGTVLGIAPGGVPAYSSDYETASDKEYPNRSAYRSYYNGIYMGYKWQCVEFARRWMYINQGYIFDDVAMAYDIFDLRCVRNITENTLLTLQAFANGCRRYPEVGSLLVWQEGGEFERTGHVAIITEVTDSYVRVAEQNVDHVLWKEGADYSRELRASVTSEGEYWISCSFGDAEILGWMIQTEDVTYAEPTEEHVPELNEIKAIHAGPKQLQKSWLNIANSDEAAFVEAMGGHFLTHKKENQDLYFAVSKTAQESLERASNELHGLFMHATEYVLANNDLLKFFNLPEAVLPKIRQSWDNRLNQVITSRFDFALTPDGLKVYEYNCDSASCYMETGKVQGRWFDYYGLKEGENAGRKLFQMIVQAWKKSKAKGLVHILRDDDIEEKYHALFMQNAIRTAGLESKIIVGLEGLVWESNGRILDADGEEVLWVWKTWAWETALDQIRKEFEQENVPQAEYEPDWRTGKMLRLSDALFRKQVMVFEPLWTLIPSNKAILPVLWTLFPNHPLLLEASFELSDSLREKGYVEKPIVGRCGHNIALFGKGETLLEQTAGNFDCRQKIYQEFFPLPKINDLYVQIATFMASGFYAGSGVRVDSSRVINKDSDCLPLLFVSDRQFLKE